jgi:hypothetical protein
MKIILEADCCDVNRLAVMRCNLLGAMSKTIDRTSTISIPPGLTSIENPRNVSQLLSVVSNLSIAPLAPKMIAPLAQPSKRHHNPQILEPRQKSGLQ